jgi:hypothetical protein
MNDTHKVKPAERTDYRTLVDRDWLGQWDLARPDGSYRDAVVEIESIKRYVPRERRKVRDKQTGKLTEEKLKRLHITFKGKRKAWLAGPVSLAALAALFGPYVQDWIGKRIALYVDPTVAFGRRTVGGIRVRPKSPDATTALTEDPLDNEVDEEKARELEDARNEWDDTGDADEPKGAA